MTDKDNSLKTLHQQFLDTLKAKNRSISTILAYGKDVDQSIEFLAKQKVTTVDGVTPDLLAVFQKQLFREKYSAKSISRKTNSLKSFFRHLVTQKVIAKSPADELTHPKYENLPPRILTKLEYRSLRDAARHDTRMRAVIELLLQTGIRIGELARLELENIREDQLYISPYQSHGERIVPLNKAARTAIDDYIAIRPKTANKALFITKTGNPLLVRNIRTAINRYFRIAGIKEAKVNDLRHTWIAYQLEAGASPLLVSKLAGHKRMATTERYLELIKKDSPEKIKIKEL